jgi:hypothetical protein
VRDLVFVAITVAFFVVCVGYVGLCDRIVGDDADDVIPAADADDTAVKAGV